MTSDADRAISSKNDRILPVIVSEPVLFPTTILKMGESSKKYDFPQMVVDKIEYLVIKSDDECETGPGNLWAIGVVCSLRKRSKEYFLDGKSRAKVIKIWRDKKEKLIARINELEDIPTMGELTETEMPMLFGCVESIRRFLKKWQEKIPGSENELHKKISEQINGIEARRRETETIYSLPWHILVNFPYFFSLSFKEEMLKTNKVIDRLLSVAEKLQQEISTFRYAESFADADTESPIKLENGVSGK